MRRTALVAIAVVALGVIAAPAAGRHRRHPVAVIACKRIAPGVCEEGGTVDLPPNNYGSQSTDTVPSDAKTADITVSPPAPPDKLPFDDLWFTIVDQVPNLKSVQNKVVQRFITCQLFAYSVSMDAAGKLDDQGVFVTTRNWGNAFAASLYVCLALAFSEPPASGASAAAVGPCQAAVGVPIQVSRSGSRYRVGAQGRTFRPRRPPPLAVTCRRRGSGLVISLRSRRRGGTLRRLLGPHLTIGFANHGSSSVRFRTNYRFSH